MFPIITIIDQSVISTPIGNKVIANIFILTEMQAHALINLGP